MQISDTYILGAILNTGSPGATAASTAAEASDPLDILISHFLTTSSFTPDEVRIIEEKPQIISAKRARLKENYPQILSAINVVQQAFQRAYAATANPTRMQALEEKAKTFLENTFRYVLMPLWAGGDWDYYGQAESPQNDPIACGYFQQRMMEHLGFNVVANQELRDPGTFAPDPDAPLQMGMLHTDAMIWSYAGQKTPDLDNWEGLRSYVEAKGEGLYLLGASSENFGHILIIDYNNGIMKVCHAGPRPGGPARVNYDDAEDYVKNFHEPHVIHTVKIDGELAQKWLTGEVILPKTKGMF